jgi:hypothetical protein
VADRYLRSLVHTQSKSTHDCNLAIEDRAKRNVRHACVFGYVLAAPVVLLQLFLSIWLHSDPSPTAQLGPPLSGAAMAPLFSANEVMEIVCVFIPAASCAVMCLWALARGFRNIEIVVLPVTVMLSVVFIDAQYFHDVFGGLMRVSIGVVLTALYSVPVFDRLRAGRRWWLWIAAVGWLALLPAVFGAAFA